MSLFQCVMAWAVRNCSWGTIFALGWGVSGFCNQNLFCAQHELSHVLAEAVAQQAAEHPQQLPAGGAHRHDLPQVPPGAPLPPCESVSGVHTSPQQCLWLLSTSATCQTLAAGNLWLNKINIGEVVASAALQLAPGALEPVSV